MKQMLAPQNDHSTKTESKLSVAQTVLAPSYPLTLQTRRVLLHLTMSEENQLVVGISVPGLHLQLLLVMSVSSLLNMRAGCGRGGSQLPSARRMCPTRNDCGRSLIYPHTHSYTPSPHTQHTQFAHMYPHQKWLCFQRQLTAAINWSWWLKNIGQCQGLMCNPLQAGGKNGRTVGHIPFLPDQSLPPI